MNSRIQSLANFSHVAALLGILLVLLMLGTTSAAPAVLHAQPLQQGDANNGAICVIAYNDANANKVRDPGEDILTDINVNLMIVSNVVLANHPLTSKEPYCFENLAPRQYTLSLDSPFYQPVDPAPLTFVLSAGERITRELGAMPKLSAKPTSAADSILNIPLTQPVRIALGLVCAAGSMAVFVGIGLIFFGIFLYRPRIQTR